MENYNCWIEHIIGESYVVKKDIGGSSPIIIFEGYLEECEKFLGNETDGKLTVEDF